MFKRNQWWRANLPLYLILFLCIICIIFMPYFITGTSFVWQSDGISQHVPALAQWQQDLKHLFKTGQWPSQWNFKIGLGADYYQTFAYYTLGDIFTYGIGFVSKNHLVTYYTVMLFVRMILAGIAFLAAVRHFTKSINPLINNIGALGYIFTGYLATALYSHPFFLNPLIIFPLLLIALDNLTNPKKPSYIPFILMVAWTLWNNYYFAFMMSLGALIFFVLKTTYTKQWFNLHYWLRIILTTLVGLLIPMTIFLPGTLGMLTSARSHPALANGLLFYPLNFYLTIPGTLINNAIPTTFWFVGGFGILDFAGLIYTLRRFKTYPILNWVFVLAGIMFVSPIFAAVMNGASSPSNRWQFMLALPLSLASVILLNHLKTLTTKDFIWMLIMAALAGLSSFYANNFNFTTNFMTAMGLALIIIALLYWAQDHRHGIIAIGIVVIFNICYIMQEVRSYDFSPVSTTLLANANVKKLLKQQDNYLNENDDRRIAMAKGEKVAAKQSPIYRSYIQSQLGNLSSIAPATNLALLSPAHNAESYWSYQNGISNQLFKHLELPNSTNNDMTNNFDTRNVLSNLLGIKYWYVNADSSAPQSYHNLPNNLTINRQSVMQSKDVYPLAYLPKFVVHHQTYMQGTSTEREAYLADSVISNALPQTSGPNQFKNFVKTTSIRNNVITPYTAQTSYNFNNKSDTQSQNGVYLKADPKLAGTELHMEISDIKFTPASFNQSANAATAMYKEEAQQNNQNPQSVPDYRYNPKAFKFNWKRNNLNQIGQNYKDFVLNASYGGQTQSFTQSGRKNLSFYNPHKSITLNLGPAKDVKEDAYIPLSFNQFGHYRFKITIKAIPNDQRFSKTAQTIQKQAVPLHITQDKITGKVKTNQPRIMVTSIPYSKGWSSKQNDILNVNDGFIGIKLKAGNNNIDLRYHTPGLKLGLILSLSGLLILLVLITYVIVKQHRKNTLK